MWSENRWFYRCQDSNPQTSWEWTHGLPVHPSVGLQQTKKPVNRHMLQASPSNCQCAFSYGLRSYQEESKIISCVQAPGAKVSYIFQHLTKTHKRHFPRLSFDWHQSIASDRALKHGIWYDPVWAMFTAWQWRCWIYVAQCSLLETECIFFLTHRWILQADPTFSQNCPNWLVNSQELKPRIFASVFFILLTAPQKKATYWYFFPSTGWCCHILHGKDHLLRGGLMGYLLLASRAASLEELQQILVWEKGNYMTSPEGGVLSPAVHLC